MKRYVIKTVKETVNELFGTTTDSDAYFEPNYNVQAGHSVPVIIHDGENKKVITARWGLRNSASDDLMLAVSRDGIDDQEAVQESIKSHPCIVPVSGFYKWKETVKDPLPFYIRVLNTDVTAVPGIYSQYQDEDGHTVHSFAVFTMEANALVQPLDESMPCILTTAQYDTWLKGEGKELLQEISGNAFLPDMGVVRVPELVNDPSNNDPELIQPIPKLRNYEE